MKDELKKIFVKQMLLPKEELALQTMELMADKMSLEKQNEAYENMRKEAIECIDKFDWFDGKIPDDIEDVPFQYCMKEDVDDLLDILNKVGDSNE